MDNIILVENQLRHKERIFELLKSQEYSVKIFESAKDALAFLEEPNQDVDLAIVAWDVAGEISGSEFLIRLKQRKITFPSIVVSSSLDLTTSNRAVILGAVDIILKPIDRDRLIESIRKALHDPRAIDPLFHELRKDIIGESPALINAVVKLSQAIHSIDTPVLLIGESGVGKEIFARLIHQKNRMLDANSKMEAINIASLSASLIESELFGHEKGAFTGADHRHIGKFERVANGTLFLDEIGYLDASLQPKLLRVIDQRTFYRVGGDQELKFEARLVCATSRNLAESVRFGIFREDLYHRISGFEIRIPPLRERKEDIRILAEYFLRNTGLRLEHETILILESYAFPGNVRELQNILKQACAVAKGKSILPTDIPTEIMVEREGSVAKDTNDQYIWSESLYSMRRDDALKEIEKQFDKTYLLRKIKEAGGNRDQAALEMGITPKTLRQKLRDCGLGHLVGQEKG